MPTIVDPYDPALTIDPSDPAWEGDPPGQNSQPCPKHLADGKITVHVVYADTRAPFEKHARIRLENPPGQPNPVPSRRSDPHGVAVFTGLGHGNYRCAATHPGYHFIPEGIRHWGSDELTLLAHENNVHWGMDTNLGDAHQPTVKIASIKSRPWHMRWIGRYVGWDKDGHPPLDHDEAKLYTGHGLKIVALWERAKYRAVDLSTDRETRRGHGDANQAFAHLADQVKAPGNAVCYFTADFDPKGGQIESDLNRVEAYFTGILEHTRGDNSRIGVYGTYKSIQRLYQKNLIKYAWQMVFDGKGNKIDPRVNIYQYDIWQHDTGPTFGVSGAGAVDLDCAVTIDDYGAFTL